MQMLKDQMNGFVRFARAQDLLIDQSCALRIHPSFVQCCTRLSQLMHDWVLQALEEKMTAKIMKEARAQNQDLEAEHQVMLSGTGNAQRQVCFSKHSSVFAVWKKKDGCEVPRHFFVAVQMFTVPVQPYRQSQMNSSKRSVFSDI